MYLLSFLLFSVLVVNAIAAKGTKTSEYWKDLAELSGNPCACSEFPLTVNATCEDQEAFDAMRNTTYNIRQLCEIIKNNTRIVSATPATEHSVIATLPPAELNKTHGAVSSINYLGCHCVAHDNSTPGSTTKSLNCTISQKTVESYNPPPPVAETFNSVCQNLSWASLPQETNDTQMLAFLCQQDEKRCLKPDSVIHSFKRICGCSNISMGELTMPCEDEAGWLIFDETIRADFDKICAFVRKYGPELEDEIQPITEITTVTEVTNKPETTKKTKVTNKPETKVTNKPETTKKTKVTNKPKTKVTNTPEVTTETGVTNTTETSTPNTAVTTDFREATKTSVAGSAPQSLSPEYTSARNYSLGIVLGIGFTAFVCGTLVAIAGKISYTRYRRRTYVNQVRA